MSKETVEEKEIDPTSKETMDGTNSDRAFQEEKHHHATLWPNLAQ